MITLGKKGLVSCKYLEDGMVGDNLIPLRDAPTCNSPFLHPGDGMTLTQLRDDLKALYLSECMLVVEVHVILLFFPSPIL